MIWHIKVTEAAEKQLSTLVEMADDDQTAVTAINPTTPGSSQMKQFGFIAGKIKIPGDFNAMGADEIQTLFEGKA